MNILNLSDFRNIEAPKNGVYVFLNTNSCPLCTDYLEILNTKNLTGWNIVKITDNEKDWIFKHEVVIGTPTTRIYLDDIVVHEKRGILYTTQYDEVIHKLGVFGL